MSLETKKYVSLAHITVPAKALVRTDLEMILRNKLRDEFEGFCNREGFVKKIVKIDYVGGGKIIEGADTCPAGITGWHDGFLHLHDPCTDDGVRVRGYGLRSLRLDYSCPGEGVRVHHGGDHQRS